MDSHVHYFYYLLSLLIVVNEIQAFSYPLKGTSSVCADVCTSVEPHVELDLSNAHTYRKHEQVQIDLHPTGSGRCREPALLHVPLSILSRYGVIKLELDFGPVLHNFSIDLGILDESNRTRRSIEIFNQQVTFDFQSDRIEPNVNIHQESVTLLEPGEHLVMFVSDDWIHMENSNRPEQTLTLYLNGSEFFSYGESDPSKVYLQIGLNRDIQGKQTGIGLCSANLTFIECTVDQEPAIDIDVNNRTYEQRDHENIHWISHLNYLDPNADVRECTAQGVLRLRFDPLGSRKIARVDFRMGSQVQGFTFNIGDSPTNNGYGGDGGTTSNSAEIHSNDNRFYIWANTKICGDTLLLKIDYNVFEPFDNISLFISNERIELTNHRSYRQILRSPYLYALDQQNVTCNCFDSLCYPGVQPDNDVYVGINRVIGGTYRPGTGVCHANVNWVQCKRIEASPRIKYEPIMTMTSTGSTPTTTTTTTTTTSSSTVSTTTTESTTILEMTSVEATTTIKSNSDPIYQTTEIFEHTNDMVINHTESSSSIMMTETSHYNNSDQPTVTPSSSSLPTTVMEFNEFLNTSIITSTMSTTTMATTTEVISSTAEEELMQTTTTTTMMLELESTVVITKDDFSSTPTPDSPTRLLNLLSNSSHALSHDDFLKTTTVPGTLSTESDPNISETTDRARDVNPCTPENLRISAVYHEYPMDKHKFIFCDSEGKMNIIACSPTYVWSQSEQSCISSN